MPYTTTPTVPQTLLEAVNELLRAVNIAQVNSLEIAQTSTEAYQALDILGQDSRTVQLRQWEFNTDLCYAIDPDTSGFINLPLNCDRATVSFRSRPTFAIQRGRRMYNRRDKTFVFTDTVYVDMVSILTFEDLPGPIKWYVTALAGRRFGTGRVADMATYKFTKAVEEDALRDALVFETESGGNLQDTSPHFKWQTRR